MTQLAADAARAWWGARRAPDFVAAEIVGPDAVADLAAVRFDRQRLLARVEAGIRPVVDVLALRVLDAARRTDKSAAQLAEECAVSISGVRRAISLALDSGALERRSGARYRTHSAWRPATTRIVAVELKLHDWTAALHQAQAYARWAHAAWAVLGRTPPDPALRAAREHGIGVAVLAPDGSVARLVRPASRPGSRLPWASVWAGEQVLARALDAAPMPVRGATAQRARPRDAAAVHLLSTGS